MENRRFRPIQGGSICPVCSVSHFPFCPHRPPPSVFHRASFGRDGLHDRFLLDPSSTIHRPLNDPFMGDRSQAMPMNGPPSDLDLHSYDKPFFNNRPMIRRDPFRPLGSGVQGMGFEFGRVDGGRGFVRDQFEERHNKRARVDDVGLDSFTQTAPSLLQNHDDYMSAERFNSENQRRLDLIRDHGAQTRPLPQVGIGMGSTFESGRTFCTELSENQDFAVSAHRFENDSRYSHGSLYEERRPSEFDAGELDIIEDQRGAASDWRNNSVSNGFSCLAPSRREHSMQANVQGTDHDFSNPPFSRNTDRIVPTHDCVDVRSGQFRTGTEQQQQMHVKNTEWFLPESDHTFQNREGSADHGALYNSHLDFARTEQHALSKGPDENARCRPNYVGSVHHMNGHNLEHDAHSSQENYRAFPSNEFFASTPGRVSQYPAVAVRQATNMQLHVDPRNSHVNEQNHPDIDLRPHPLFPLKDHMESKHDCFSQNRDTVTALDDKALPLENIQGPVEPDWPESGNINRGGSIESPGNCLASQAFLPFPALLPHPSSVKQSGSLSSHFKTTTLPPTTCSPIFCVPPSSAHVHATFPPGSQSIQNRLADQFEDRDHVSLPNHGLMDRPKVIDATQLFRIPYRKNRPDHIVIILRGLPGSGKSYLAKMLRDLEVENGGNAPRIHSMDDYFMIEVEKVEDIDSSKSSSSGKGMKRITKKVMEYCYEPEMEEAYRSSMLKSFKKTLEEGIFTFIIVDDRNLRVADFAQFWATAKRSGYEVYLLEATYKDPLGCAARNVHGFTSDDIKKMAEQWEEAPPLYLKLDIQSLFHGDNLNEHGIAEVDMDMDDVAGDISVIEERKDVGMTRQTLADYSPNGAGESWDAEGDDQTENVKELGRSKWSEDLDEDLEQADGTKRNLSALSGLIHAYGRGSKSVLWGDQVGNSGFSIGAAKKTRIASLLIGPGAGYNSSSNPLPEHETDVIGMGSGNEPRKRTAFLEQLRAERESFRAVFDRRRQRIDGLEADED